MSKNFKKFLNELKNEENEKLMETIMEGFENLFEAPDEEEGERFEEEEEQPVDEVYLTPDAEQPEEEEKDMETNNNNTGMMKLIEGLNGDLLREYAAAIQYIQHAAMMTGAATMSISQEMLVHADEEIAHAKTISDRINYLGGIPTVEVGPIKTSKSSGEMIQQDKEGEEEAIERYKERIRQAEAAGDFGTKNILMGILVEEEGHRNDLIIALGQ